MEIQLNHADIENIISEWAHGLGYEVNAVKILPTTEGEIYGIVQTKRPDQPVFVSPLVPGHVEPEHSCPPGFLAQSTGKWRVEYSLQDEGPTPYDGEFETDKEAIAFIMEREEENPLKGTIMYHLISPEGHIYDGVTFKDPGFTPPFGGRLRQR